MERKNVETEKREVGQGSINMIMSFFFIALSAAIGVGMWFLVIGIVFSIGGGSLFVTHYDSLFFYSAVLLLCIVSYLWFIKHLFEKNWNYYSLSVWVPQCSFFPYRLA